jgi:hypothetical protein
MERRKGKRIKKRILSKIDEKSAITIDLSKDGLQISLKSNPHKKNINVTLQIGDKYFDLKGEIRWMRKEISTQGSNRIGIFLKDVPPEYAKILNQFIPTIAEKTDQKDQYEDMDSLFKK